MSNITEFFNNNVLAYFKDRVKLGSLKEKDVQEMLSIQYGYLTDIHGVLATMDTNIINTLRDKYLRTPKRNQDKINNQYIIPGFIKDTSGKVQQLEKNRAFLSVLTTAEKYIKLNLEVQKNLHVLLEDKYIVLQSAKLSDVMVLGILREMDMFAKYTSYLWEYFEIVTSNGASQVGYRAMYLADNYDKYLSVLTNVCNKAENYSFLRDVDTMRRQSADLVLYANGNPFTNLFDFRKYNKDMEDHITHGLFGFGVFTWIIEKWDMWKHAQYQKKKMHKEWLKQEQSKLLQTYQNQDPGTPEAQRTQQLIDAYSDAITDLDAKINEYEHVDNR